MRSAQVTLKRSVVVTARADQLVLSKVWPKTPFAPTNEVHGAGGPPPPLGVPVPLDVDVAVALAVVAASVLLPASCALVVVVSPASTAGDGAGADELLHADAHARTHVEMLASEILPSRLSGSFMRGAWPIPHAFVRAHAATVVSGLCALPSALWCGAFASARAAARSRLVNEESTEKKRAPRPYEDAPKLPESPKGEHVDARSIVQGAWLELEVGPGRGGFLFERALAEPTCGLIGLEVRRKWAAIVDRRLAKAGLGARARVFAEDAKDALPRLGPDGVFKRAYLLFPDPWWKKRHAKRLVMGDVFMEQVARLLMPGGELFVETDVEERAHMYTAQISLSPHFSPAGDAEGAPEMAENPYNARSPREHRAIADGLPVHRLRYRRI